MLRFSKAKFIYQGFYNRFMAKNTPYILSLIAGILIILQGIVMLALPSFLTMIPGLDFLGFLQTMMMIFGAWGIVLGIVLVYGGYMFSKGKKNGGMIVLIFSIISFLVGPNGFVIGSVLGIIGGILAIRTK